MNWDRIKIAISSVNDETKMLINSSKIKYLGNLHQQIINGVENGNSIFNRFEIDNDILNNYKQYYEYLFNFTKSFNHNTLSDNILDKDYSSKTEQIKKIIKDIYTKLYGKNELNDFDDIISVFINEDINSEENLKGNNILKILANFAIAIDDCFQNIVYAILQLQFGEIISVGDNTLIDGGFLMETLNQFKTINDVFGIKSQE